MMVHQQPKPPPEGPRLGPKGTRTPEPADEPIGTRARGSEPDYFPGTLGSDPPKFRQSARHPRLTVGWLQAH
ncbi:MAG: hypothetical protein WBD95_03090 [Xanthobacteraceae bacterium]